MDFSLPRRVEKPTVPPLKIQGIKSDLVDFIGTNVKWDGEGRWIEPFLGSGVVLFSLKPDKAFVSDLNEHIINLYKGIQEGDINGKVVRSFLEHHGSKLKEKGEEYYYEMRDEFNKNGDPLYLLFLNRSCYNGMMRFNLSGGFNVPFCKKPERFRKAYVTRIVNQIEDVRGVIKNKDWVFKSMDWKESLNESNEEDFVYLDPPYVGRNTGYSGEWTEEEADDLAEQIKNLPCGYAMSTWIENKHRRNERVDTVWSNHEVRSYSHFYYVGSTEDLRGSMEEGLIIKDGYQVSPKEIPKGPNQKEIFE